MPVSSLLLTVDPEHRDAVRATLSADPRCDVGDHIGTRLPVALETPSREADRDAWEWIRAIDGVTWIDLVWITIDDDDAKHFTPGRPHAGLSHDGADQ